MIDDFSDKILKWSVNKGFIKEEQYSDIDFYFRIFLFNFIVICSLLFFSILLDSWKEMIILSIVFNTIRVNCIDNGFHAETLEKCISITVPYITICSVIAHIFIFYYMIFCILSIIGGFYIYIRYVPNKICIENKNKYLIILLSLIGLMTLSVFLCPFLALLKVFSISIAIGILSVVCITCDKFENFLRVVQKYL